MALVPRPVRLPIGTTFEQARERIAMFFEDTRAALARGLSFAENSTSDIKTINWVGGQTDLAVATKLKSPVQGAVMIALLESEGAAISTAYMDWEPANVNGTNGIRIRTISGLTADARYSVRLLLVGG